MKILALALLVSLTFVGCKKEPAPEMTPVPMTTTEQPMVDGSDMVEPSDCVCTEIFAPVCGVDGRTYGNACIAECRKVEVASEGECGSEPAEY